MLQTEPGLQGCHGVPYMVLDIIVIPVVKKRAKLHHKADHFAVIIAARVTMACAACQE